MKSKTPAALMAALCHLCICGTAQTVPILSESIAVAARPSADSITLRWAPLDFRVWYRANRNGYRIERYTLVRDGRLLANPEKRVMAGALKPLPEPAWEKLVQRNRYAAIAAQALFGERFEADLGGSHVFSIVNKVRENEQRFAFALFSADMAPEVARASGLWFSDSSARTNEKYLYRVVISGLDSLRGSIYVSPSDTYNLKAPPNLKVTFKDRVVSLRWEKSASGHYTAYSVERSEDGQRFISITETPLVGVSPDNGNDNRYEYATDTLSDASKVYHYRVRGLTPFGESGPPSHVVEARVIRSVSDVPYITAVQNRDNRSLVIQWTFPQSDQAAIKGFSIERTSRPGAASTLLTRAPLAPGIRAFEDTDPDQSNYYRVSALGRDGESYASHVYFAQLVDSIPPGVPKGLSANVNDDGLVTLTWIPGADPDLYGYRVFKAYHRSEEPAQISREPARIPLFTDSVDLQTLNDKVYYRVMAVDIQQNQSALSDWLGVALPDKMKPQPPVFLPIQAGERGITLRWTSAGSNDVVQYRLFRRAEDQTEWVQLQVMDATGDTTWFFTDRTAASGKRYLYTIVAVDDAGLESDPAEPVTAARLHTPPPAIEWTKPRVNREENRITLGWRYDRAGIRSFRIFRSVDGGPPLLFRTLGGEENKFTDTMIPGRRYSYRIMALWVDGNQSSLSGAMEFQY